MSKKRDQRRAAHRKAERELKRTDVIYLRCDPEVFRNIAKDVEKFFRDVSGAITAFVETFRK